MTFLPALFAAMVAAAPVPSTFRIAVIVGRNDGGPGREVLRWAHKDAESIAAVMGELGGIATSDRVLLIEPDKNALDATLALVQARLALVPTGARSELLFYYSGHADEVGLMLGRERYAFRDLRARLDAIEVDLRLVVVDACASGALIGKRTKGGKKTAPFLGDGDLSGHAYLTSAAADEVAQESDSLEASFFTHDLITGLRGAADRDRDRTVTLTEAYRYAFDATLARTQATTTPQHPAWDIALTGAGDVVLTRLDSPSARLLFAAPMSGRFFIRGARDVLAAELQKEAGDPLELALPPGSWRVATHKGGRRLEADALLANNAPLTLSSNDFRDVGPALEGRARGEPPIRLRVSVIPLIGFDGLGDDVVVHGLALSLIGDRILAIRGAQLTTLFNVADEVTGAQIGLVNIGGDVRGAQIGLVNVADSLEGASLALFPVGRRTRRAAPPRGLWRHRPTAHHRLARRRALAAHRGLDRHRLPRLRSRHRGRHRDRPGPRRTRIRSRSTPRRPPLRSNDARSAHPGGTAHHPRRARRAGCHAVHRRLGRRRCRRRQLRARLRRRSTLLPVSARARARSGSRPSAARPSSRGAAPR